MIKVLVEMVNIKIIQLLVMFVFIVIFFLGNVLKEIVEPAGAIIYANKFELGDPTINSLELWGAEYQENNAILCDEKDLEILKTISIRERCPVLPVGVVTNNGKVNYVQFFFTCLWNFNVIIY